MRSSFCGADFCRDQANAAENTWCIVRAIQSDYQCAAYGLIFPLSSLLFLEYTKYPFVLPPRNRKKSVSSAVVDFEGKRPVIAARRTVAGILAYDKAVQHSGCDGHSLQNALLSLIASPKRLTQYRRKSARKNRFGLGFRCPKQNGNAQGGMPQAQLQLIIGLPLPFLPKR